MDCHDRPYLLAVKRFNQPSEKIPQCDHLALIVVVCKLGSNLMDVDVSGKTPPQSIGKLNFPSIWSANDASSPLKKFYCYNKDDYDCLTKQYPDGLLLIQGQNYAEQIDDVVKQHSFSIFHLSHLIKLNLKRRQCLVGISFL